MVGQRAVRLIISLAGVALVTFVGSRLLPINPTTQGFAYLLLVLIIATGWGFFEAAAASVASTLTFNFFFFEPIGTFTIDDPRNWVALFSFLATSLIASRLSAEAKRRTLEALARQQDLERLYTFSRAILLFGNAEPFPKQLVQKLAEIFELSAVVLYDRRTEEFYRAGPSEFEGLDDQLHEAALQGTSFNDASRNRVITGIRLGSEPIAGLALQGAQMPDSVLQALANLVAVGLERARAEDLASQIEAAKRSEKLRTTLIDAMAHELKTPLTSVMAATTAFLADPNQALESKTELIRIADEEVKHLKEIIDESLETARLDSSDIQLQREPSNVGDIVREVVSSMRREIDHRPLEFTCDEDASIIAVDRRLMKLAIKQLLDNALKYSPADTPIEIKVHRSDGTATVAITDHGKGISAQEQKRIFERLYRGSSVQHKIPGSGLGLSIAQDIVRAHRGDLTVTSRPGETTFRLNLPAEQDGGRS